METDTLTILRHKENILLVVRLLYLDQLIIFPECDRCKSGLSDIGIIGNR